MSNNYLKQLRTLILNYLTKYDASVYLFGSRAKGAEHEASDIDIGILSARKLPNGTLSKLREKVEESTIPYTVDIIDLTKTDKKFREAIIKEGVLWKDYNKE